MLLFFQGANEMNAFYGNKNSVLGLATVMNVIVVVLAVCVFPA